MAITFVKTVDDKCERLDCKHFYLESTPLHESYKKQFAPLTFNRLNARLSGGKRLSSGALIDESGDLFNIPYIRAEDVKDHIVNFEESVKISEIDYSSIVKYSLETNDICISIVGTIGRIGFVEKGPVKNAFSENIAKITFNSTSNIEPKYIYYYMRTHYAKAQYERLHVGSLQYKLSINSLRNKFLVLVPLENGIVSRKRQADFVNFVENVIGDQILTRNQLQIEISKLSSIIDSYWEIPPRYFSIEDTYIAQVSPKRSRLDAVFYHPKRDFIDSFFKHIPHVKLKDLLDKNTYQDSSILEYYQVVDLDNIDENTGEITGWTDKNLLGSSKIKFDENNILVSKLYGEKTKIAVVASKYSNCCGSSELLQFRVKNPEEVEYVRACLMSKIVYEQWSMSLVGSSRMRINDNIIMNTIIPFPNQDEREKIVSTLKMTRQTIVDLKSKMVDINDMINQVFCEFFKV